MIEGVKKHLEIELAASGGSVGLFLSGGSDSLLLLSILMDMKATFDVVCFDNTFTRAQQAHIDTLIEKYGLRVFSYPPAAMYLMGDGRERVTLVEEYAFPHGAPIPFLRDCTQDDWKCVYDTEFKMDLQPRPPIGFKLNIFGTRRFDYHYALGRVATEQKSTANGVTFYLPLYSWSRADVSAALQTYGLDPVSVDTGEVPLCTRCLTAKENVACPKSVGAIVAPFDWKPTETLTAFRNKYDRRLLPSRERQPAQK